MEVREGEANLSNEKGDCVTIMTVHGSKGLDFPIVFVPRLSAKINYNKSRMLFHPGEGVALSMKTPFQQEESFMYNYLRRQEKFRTFAEEKRRNLILYFLLMTLREKRVPNMVHYGLRYLLFY